MRVNVYEEFGAPADDMWKLIEEDVELSPDEYEYQFVEAELRDKGVIYVGGGASPMFKLERVDPETGLEKFGH